jgi:hypothetical protein
LSFVATILKDHRKVYPISFVSHDLFSFLQISSNLYHTEAYHVKYGDQQIQMREQAGNTVQVIFDSGSSYTYLPNEIYENLVAAVSIAGAWSQG